MKHAKTLILLFLTLLASLSGVTSARSYEFARWDPPTVLNGPGYAIVGTTVSVPRAQTITSKTCFIGAEISPPWKVTTPSPATVPVTNLLGNESHEVWVRIVANRDAALSYAVLDVLIECGPNASSESFILRYANDSIATSTRSEYLNWLAADDGLAAHMPNSRFLVQGGKAIKNFEDSTSPDDFGLPPGARDSLKHALERRSNLGSIQAPLSAASSEPAVLAHDTGCNVTLPTPSMVLIIALAIVVARRRPRQSPRSLAVMPNRISTRVRKWLVSGLVLTISLAVTTRRASGFVEERCAFGWIVFWDSRGVSDAGSYLGFNFTLETSTDLVVADRNHNLVAGDKVQVLNFTSGSGLQVGTTYYVRSGGLTANSFTVSLTLGGSKVNITTTGNGRMVVVAASSLTGWRIAGCDPTDYTCDWWESQCCYTGVPLASATLARYAGGVLNAIVDGAGLDEYGVFNLCDSAWDSTGNYTYRVVVQYSKLSATPPAKILFKAIGYPNGTWATFSPSFSMTSSLSYAGNLSLNTPGDTTSSSTDLAEMWTTAIETLSAFEAQGETKHRYWSANAYDTITMRYPETGASNTISPDWVSLNPSTRGIGTSHEFGHLLHFRMFEASNSDVFPHPASGPVAGFDHRSDGPEGAAAFEGIPGLATLLWAFSTATTPASTFTAPGQLGECVNSASSFYENSNDATVPFSVSLGLWELLDTPTSGPSGDSVDIALPALTSALILHAGSGGNLAENRKANEWTLALTQAQCTFTFQCANASEVCSDQGQCLNGDVHGANIRDWIHWLPIGGGVTEAMYVQTIESSPCLGGPNQTGDGGYRDD